MTSDSLFTFAISPNNGSFALIQDFPAYGLGPRQFSINENGTLVAVALGTSNRLTVIGRNVATGMMTQMLGYLDLDVGGAPGLVTSAVFDEAEDAGQSSPQGVGTYTDTTIVVGATGASSVSKAPASTAAGSSLQTAVSKSPVNAPTSIPTAVTPASSAMTAPQLTSTAAVTPASNAAGSAGTFVTSPLSGGPPPTGPASNLPTTAAGATGSAAGSATGVAGATPSPIQTGIAGNCVKYHQVVAGDTCSSIATGASIALTDFYTWNPAVGTDCKALLAGFHACTGIGS